MLENHEKNDRKCQEACWKTPGKCCKVPEKCQKMARNMLENTRRNAKTNQTKCSKTPTKMQPKMIEKKVNLIVKFYLLVYFALSFLYKSSLLCFFKSPYHKVTPK